jgi:hypothetical protein
LVAACGCGRISTLNRIAARHMGDKHQRLRRLVRTAHELFGVRWQGSPHCGVSTRNFGRGNDPCQLSAWEGSFGSQRLTGENWLYCFRVGICDLLIFSAFRSALSFSRAATGQAAFRHNPAAQSWRHFHCQYCTPNELLLGLSYAEDFWSVHGGRSTNAVQAAMLTEERRENTIFNCLKRGILTEWNIDKSFRASPRGIKF